MKQCIIFTAVVFVAVAASIGLCEETLADPAIALRIPVSDVLGHTDGEGNTILTGSGMNDRNAYSLSTVAGFAFDADHNMLFVADEMNGRVLAYETDTNGLPLDVKADYVLGKSNMYNGVLEIEARGKIDERTLFFPCALLYRDDILWVADRALSRVVGFDVSGGVEDYMPATYLIGQTNWHSGMGGTSTNSLDEPAGLAYCDPWLLVSDSSDHRILGFDISGPIAPGMNADFVLGQSNFFDDVDGTGSNRFEDPVGLAVVSHWLACADSRNDRVVLWDLNKTNLYTYRPIDCVLGDSHPSNTTVTGRTVTNGFSYPFALASRGNELYVSDRDLVRIMKFDLSLGVGNGMNASDVLGDIAWPDVSWSAYGGARMMQALCSNTTSRTFKQPIGLGVVGNRLWEGDFIESRALLFNLDEPLGLQQASAVLGQTDEACAPLLDKRGVNNRTATSLAFFMATGGGHTLALESEGSMLVADSYNGRILEFKTDAQMAWISNCASRVIGQPGFYTGMPLPVLYEMPFAKTTRDRISHPVGLVEYGGNLYVSSPTENRVLVYDLDTVWTNGSIPVAVIGQTTWTNKEEGLTFHHLFVPLGMDVSPNGLLFVAEGENNRVTVFDIESGVPETGMNALLAIGQSAFTNVEQCTQNGMDGPMDVDVSPDGKWLAVADSENNRVLLFDTFYLAMGMDATYVLGQNHFTTNESGTSSIRMDMPTGVHFTDDRLYVADLHNGRLMVWDLPIELNGQPADYVVGVDSSTEDIALPQMAVDRLGFPFAVNVQDDWVWITDILWSRVAALPESEIVPEPCLFVICCLSFTIYHLFRRRARELALLVLLGVFLVPAKLRAEMPDAVGVIGQPNMEWCLPNAEGARRIIDPWGVAVSTNMHLLFISDQNFDRILVFELDAGYTPVTNVASCVLGQAGPGLRFRTTDRTRIVWPYGLAFDDRNSLLYAGDGNGERVMVFDLSGGISNGMPTSFVLGQTNFTDEVSGLAANRLRDPMAIALWSNWVFVADNLNQRVLAFDRADRFNGPDARFVIGETTFTTRVYRATATNMMSPSGLLVFDNWLLVADRGADRVTGYDLGSGLANNMPATLVLGQTNFTDSGNASGTNRFNHPVGLARYQDYLLVGDHYNKRVLVFDGSGGFSNGMNAAFVIGKTDFFGGDSYACSNLLDEVNEIAVAGSILYVADEDNERVVPFDLTGGIANGMSAFTVLGQFDPDGSPNLNRDGIMPCPSGLSWPAGAAYDPVGRRLFVADSDNSRVLAFATDESGLVTNPMPLAVLGQTNLYARDYGMTASMLGGPSDVAVDPELRRLYVADSWNARVLQYEMAGGVSNGMDAAAVIGQTTFTSAVWAISQTNVSYPVGLALSQNGLLYVSDQGFCRLTAYDVAGSVKNGQLAIGLIGQTNYNTREYRLSPQGVPTARGMAFNGDSTELFVADEWHSRVLRFDVTDVPFNPTGNMVWGQSTFYSATWGTTDKRMSGAPDCAYHDGLLAVADSGNNRLMIWDADAAALPGEPAITAIGQPDFTTPDLHPAAPNTFCYPYGLLVAGDYVYVSDAENNRVLIFRNEDVFVPEPGVVVLMLAVCGALVRRGVGRL